MPISINLIMVRKLTARKTIAVKDATYAVATKNSLKKKIIYWRLRKCDHDGKLSNAPFSGGTKHATTNFSIIILNVFRFLKKFITKQGSLNFFESLFRSFVLTERLKQACVYSRDNGHLLAGFAHEQILS